MIRRAIKAGAWAIALGFGLANCAGAGPGLRTEERVQMPVAAEPRTEDLVARFWEMDIDPARLEAFRAIGAENQEASTRLEPGVLMMHSVQLADDPTQVRVLEVYANQGAYESHIRSAHFLRFRTASAPIVRSQELVPIKPILLCAKGGTIGSAEAQEAMVRIAVLEIDPAQLDRYLAFLTEEQEASVRLEPGVLMLHSFQYAEDPAQVRLLEVYASRAAYESHIQSPHFLKYKNGTEQMVRSLELVSTRPILLAARPRPTDGSVLCM